MKSLVWLKYSLVFILLVTGIWILTIGFRNEVSGGLVAAGLLLEAGLFLAVYWKVKISKKLTPGMIEESSPS
jgi:hypothetical protein